LIVVGWWWSILTCDVIEAEKKRSGAKSAPRSEKALLEGQKKVLLGAPEQSASAEHYFSHNNNKGGVLKYLRFSKILFHGQKRKKIFTDTPIFDD